jgi:hypothetical protein
MAKRICMKKNFAKVITLSLPALLTVNPAMALDSSGNGPTRNDAIALYVFDAANVDPVTRRIKDQGQDPKIDLEIVRSNGLVMYRPDHIELSEPNLVRSVSSMDKITNACKTSNELTVEMWVESRTPSDRLVNHENQNQLPASVFRQALRMVSLGDTYFKEYNNFGFYQTYNMGDTYRGTIRTSANSNENINGSLVDPLVAPRETFLLQKKQQVFFVRTAGGSARFYNTDDNGYITGPFNAPRGFGGNFANWHSSGTSVTFDTLDDSTGQVTRNLDIRLSIGNDSAAEHDFSKSTQGGESLTKRSRHWPWMGKIYMVAVYCRALTENEILGAGAPRNTAPPVFPIDVSRRLKPSMYRAQTIFTRMTGVKTPIDNPVIGEMADLIDSNRSMDAAALTISDPNFYNITVRDMAAKMSTREEVISTTLNDFIATVVGVARDKVDARALLNSDLVYIADPTKAAVPSNWSRDLLQSNRHYESLQDGKFDLKKVLMPSNQMIFDGTTSVAHPDPAGLITTRAFMSAHAVAGTNRRLVEYAFRQFLCVPIDKWADSNGSDAPVGRDIDRFPAGSHSKFTTSCRSCHSKMDPLRGAFAYVTFSNNFAKHSMIVNALPLNTLPANFNEDNNMGMATGLRAGDSAATTLPSLGNVNFVTKKMNHNDHVFPGGRVITDNSFANAATDTWGQNYFGWRGKTSGKGMKEFGTMIANSEQFSRCMAKRVFTSVCKREPQSFDDSLIKTAAQEFETNDYRLDYLFKRIVITPNCLGEDK